jgi:branched-subunit amino acid transport protein
MSSGYVWAVIIGMAVANYAVRFVPMALLSKPLLRFLSFIPVTVMSALTVGEILRPDGRWLSPVANPYLFAALPTAFVYYKWRSFLGTTVAGIAFFLVFRALVG